ncbi:hypothetical protein VF_B0019 (plasmid) [Aliivibrio fischeri ES114]|uniref:Uncharacterized protein n=1 Tax=Aliivibrio fischeri (strain ATCC 700601 / ES114) TaxID=312309 RepID=Q5DY85_ALIF1|nr:hypothetical protein VF_B0019 [Aliivibrio fischeri ES114]
MVLAFKGCMDDYLLQYKENYNSSKVFFMFV